jgi:hypothetical protein
MVQGGGNNYDKSYTAGNIPVAHTGAGSTKKHELLFVTGQWGLVSS